MDRTGDITGPINLGNPVEFTILELAEKVLAIAGSRSRIEFRPLPADDPRQRKSDTDFGQKMLGWESKVPLEEGLRRTVAYFERLVRDGRA